jgi:hypothetical protein
LIEIEEKINCFVEEIKALRDENSNLKQKE